MDKMAAPHHKFTQMGILAGMTSSYMEQMKAKDEDTAAELPVITTMEMMMMMMEVHHQVLHLVLYLKSSLQ